MLQLPNQLYIPELLMEYVLCNVICSQVYEVEMIDAFIDDGLFDDMRDDFS